MPGDAVLERTAIIRVPRPLAPSDDRAEFIEAARRAGLSPEEATEVTRAMLETLTDRVSGSEMEDVAGQLPRELRDPWLAPPIPPSVEHAS